METQIETPFFYIGKFVFFNILDFAEKHLIPEICQCEQLGEQNLKSENLRF